MRAGLGVADEHGRVRRHQRLLRAVFRGLCVSRWRSAGVRVHGWDVQLRCWPRILRELPSGLLLRGRRGPPRGLRGGQRAADQRLAVDGGVSISVRRGNSRADGI